MRDAQTVLESLRRNLLRKKEKKEEEGKRQWLRNRNEDNQKSRLILIVPKFIRLFLMK